MNRKILFLSSAGGALVASIVLALLWPRETARPVPSEDRLVKLESAILAGTEARASLVSALDSLVTRIDGLESRLDRRATGPSPPAPPQAPPVAVPAVEEPVTGASGASRRQFLGQLADAVRVTRGGLGDDEEGFWEMARTTTMLDESIDALRARIEADPGDGDARMQLADAYVGKLLTVPYGPERGIWGARAEEQWQAVLERDPQHWEAQFVLAYNYSMYPDFVAKTDEAIHGFENAVRIQEASPHRPEHARTYVQLARMYEKQGELDKARQALQNGAERHPGNEAIAQALARLGGR